MSRFRNETAFRHDAQERMGVLLVNLGTPDEPTTKAVRRYLAEFLWDPRVVEVPRPLWWLILHLGILRFRPSRSAEAYSQVWSEKGSPLLPTKRKWARYGESGLEISDWFPHVAKHADDLAVIRSCYGEGINHSGGCNLMNTCSTLGGRPSLGAGSIRSKAHISS